jgi:GNAT superfamily N-acetyltransferase
MKLFLIFITLCILIIILLVLRFLIQNLENFQVEPPSYITEETEDYSIHPFHQATDKVKKDVVKHLQDEWKDTGIEYTEAFVEDTWKYPDALYVMTDNKGQLIGCSGIDRKYMYPFISHIYVKKEYRKKGYGEKMFGVVLEHGKQCGYKCVKGWCKDELVNYYENFGCQKEKGSWLIKPFLGFNLMKKDL